jgi:hypothetical protein
MRRHRTISQRMASETGPHPAQSEIAGPGRLQKCPSLLHFLSLFWAGTGRRDIRIGFTSLSASNHPTA